MIRLLGRHTSGNVQKVLWLLEELGVAYEREDYGRQFGNTQTDEYRALNPNAKVPTLIAGDTVIWESHSILRYLAAMYGPALTGTSRTRRSRRRSAAPNSRRRPRNWRSCWRSPTGIWPGGSGSRWAG